MNNTLQEIAEKKYPDDGESYYMFERAAFISGMEQKGIGELVECLKSCIGLIRGNYPMVNSLNLLNRCEAALSSFKEGNNGTIKEQCERQYEIIKSANEKLKSLRADCKHENKYEGNYSWRLGAINCALICSDCGQLIKFLDFPEI